MLNLAADWQYNIIIFLLFLSLEDKITFSLCVLSRSSATGSSSVWSRQSKKTFKKSFIEYQHQQTLTNWSKFLVKQTHTFCHKKNFQAKLTTKKLSTKNQSLSTTTNNILNLVPTSIHYFELIKHLQWEQLPYFLTITNFVKNDLLYHYQQCCSPTNFPIFSSDVCDTFDSGHTILQLLHLCTASSITTINDLVISGSFGSKGALHLQQHRRTEDAHAG